MAWGRLSGGKTSEYKYVTQSCTSLAHSNFHTLCLQQSAWDALLGDHWPYSLSGWSSLSWRSRRGALWRRCRPSSKITSNPSNRPIPESSPVKWYSSISLLIVYYIQSICKFEFLLSKTWTLSMTPACRMRLLSSFLVSRYPKYFFFKISQIWHHDYIFRFSNSLVVWEKSWKFTPSCLPSSRLCSPSGRRFDLTYKYKFKIILI